MYCVVDVWPAAWQQNKVIVRGDANTHAHAYMRTHTQISDSKVQLEPTCLLQQAILKYVRHFSVFEVVHA